MKTKRLNQPEVVPGDTSSPSFFNGLMLGVVAGAVSYFLFATKKGKRVRLKLTEEAKLGWRELNAVADKAEAGGKKIHKDLQKLKSKVEQDAERVQIEAQKEIHQLQENARQAQQKADEIQAKLKDAAAKIEKRFFTRGGRSLGK